MIAAASQGNNFVKAGVMASYSSFVSSTVPRSLHVMQVRVGTVIMMYAFRCCAVDTSILYDGVRERKSMCKVFEHSFLQFRGCHVLT